MIKFIAAFLVFQVTIVYSQIKTKSPTPYELGNKNQTATYEETLLFFQTLATSHKSVTLTSKGNSDQGNPMHLVLFDASGKTTEKQLNINKQILLINNLIHPGEPDGNDATQQLFRDLAENGLKSPKT